MTDAVSLGAYLSAGFILLGLLGTALIPRPRPQSADPAQPRTAHV